jgi:hypothetical protein
LRRLAKHLRVKCLFVLMVFRQKDNTLRTYVLAFVVVALACQSSRSSLSHWPASPRVRPCRTGLPVLKLNYIQLSLASQLFLTIGVCFHENHRNFNGRVCFHENHRFKLQWSPHGCGYGPSYICTYVRTYVRTYARTHVRTYVRT